MLPGLNSGGVGKNGPTGWVTRWVLGTAVGQVVFTGTVRLVLAVLMGAALGGLAVWLVLRHRQGAQRHVATSAAESASGRTGRRVRAEAEAPHPAYPGHLARPAAGSARPRFSPRANRAGRPAPEHPAPPRPAREHPPSGGPAPNRTTGARTASGTVPVFPPPAGRRWRK